MENVYRHFARLENRLEELLKWSNPDNVLQGVIDKVRRQQSRPLTFVCYSEVPCHNNFADT